MSTYTVTRSASINASPEKVYSEIVDLHRWEAWSPWLEMDPDMEKTYSGPDSGPGAKYAWSGNRKVGSGTMEITATDPNARVAIELQFLKPFKATNDTELTLTPDGDGTTVTWAMTGQKTLMTRIMGIFKSMDAMVGPDFERGLSKLKSVAEGS